MTNNNMIARMTLLLSLVFLISLVAAVPQNPHVVVGNVIYSGDETLSLDAYSVVANVGPYPFSAEIDSNNQFELIIGVDSAWAGDEILFAVDNVSAVSSPVILYTPGGHNDAGPNDFDALDYINLTIDEIPEGTIVCGNGVKESGEFCDGSDFGIIDCSLAMIFEGEPAGYIGNLACTDSCTFNTTQCSLPTPTCSDGIQNGDETGVDCGGSCSACSTGGDSGSGGSSSSGGGGGGSVTYPSADDDNETIGTSNEGSQGSNEEVTLTNNTGDEEFTSLFTGAFLGQSGQVWTGIGVFALIVILGAVAYWMFNRK